MSTATETIEDLVKTEYKYGFYTDVETESAPPGLSEDTIRMISRKKNEPEWLTDWRLKAYRHWLTMTEPTWQKAHHEKINYQDIVYFSQPKPKKDAPKSLDEVDPKLLETYEKLGIPLRERGRLAGVAVDAIFDSVSVGTTFRKQLAEKGVIFCSFTEAVHEHPELVKKYLGSVVPYTDNFSRLRTLARAGRAHEVVRPTDRCARARQRRRQAGGQDHRHRRDRSIGPHRRRG